MIKEEKVQLSLRLLQPEQSALRDKARITSSSTS